MEESNKGIPFVVDHPEEFTEELFNNDFELEVSSRQSMLLQGIFEELKLTNKLLRKIYNPE